ncbi:MAG: GNAT family N-acetyltransferase [Pseudomonadota bacterium]|nr:GNAT family N-acetyltransferase [Pseudomonadota bacterium]
MSRPILDESGLARLEHRWRKLAAESDASYFQDWGWVGCMAAERYADPVLIEVQRDETLVGLALFDRRSTPAGVSLHLQESTDPSLASIFVEHNGPLLSIADPVLRQALLASIFSHAIHGPLGAASTRARRLVLSGVAPDCADAASMTGGLTAEKSARVAPYANLLSSDPARPFIQRLSRNTRHQLRRSNRVYAAQASLTVCRAETVESGLAFLSDMIVLHDRTWLARGKKGAFSTPAVRRFYRQLIAGGIPAGEVDLLRVAAGDAIVGYLMNFTHAGTVSAYQSGFDYASAGSHQKPGLTCHYLAIEHYQSRGFHTYDFLAGADRYKLSLANAQRRLHWLSVMPAWHPAAIGTRLRQLLHV